MRFLTSFALREFKRIRGHQGFLFLVLVWPLLYAFLFGRIYSERVISKLPVIILDEDKSQLSRTILRYLDSSRSFNIIQTAENPQDIEDSIANNQSSVGFYIPRNLESSLKRGQPAKVIAFVNASNLSIGNLATADLRLIVGTVSAGIQLKYLQKSGSSSKRALNQIQPLKIETARLHNPGFSYLNYVAPGLWAAILHQLLVLFGSLALVREFELGRSRELWAMADNSPWRLLLGKVFPYLIIGTLLFASYFSLLFPAFDLPLENYGLNILIFSLPLILAAVSYGLALSAATKSTLSAIKGVLLLTSPAFSLSGFIWPLSSMPVPLQWLAQIIPLTPYLKGYRKIIQEGAPLSAVGWETLHLFILASVALFLGWLSLYRGRKAVS